MRREQGKELASKLEETEEQSKGLQTSRDGAKRGAKGKARKWTDVQRKEQRAKQGEELEKTGKRKAGNPEERSRKKSASKEKHEEKSDKKQKERRFWRAGMEPLLKRLDQIHIAWEKQQSPHIFSRTMCTSKCSLGTTVHDLHAACQLLF